MSDLLDRLRGALGDRYDVMDEVARGGMAIVFRAHDRQLGRDVAVKVLAPALSEAMSGDRFLREIQIGARLQHPHILTLHDSGQSDSLVYYVMPFVTGETLRARLEQEGELPFNEALRLTREIASALQYAHEQGIIHRDLKPDNILLSSGQAMLADFGIAEAIVEVGGERLTATGVAIGTPEYMSPEQAAGDKGVDARSDVYALGCVLYEMLTGEPPFTGRTARAVIARQIGERPPSVEVVRPDIPSSVGEAIKTALAKSPADRFRSVAEFVAALEVKEPAPPPSWGRTVAAVAIVGALVGFVIWLVSRPPAPTLDPNKIAVFPLEERGLTPAQAGAGNDVVVLIATALEHADPIRPLDIRDRLTPTQRENAGNLQASERRAIAERQGAGFYVAGVVQGHGDSTTVAVRLYDVAGDSLVEERSSSGSLGTVPLHHLGIDATVKIIPSLVDPGRRIDLTALRDRDPSAIALFIQGERQYRFSQFTSALTFYERALATDSALALAAIKGAQAASWGNDQPRALSLVTLAVERDSLLPPRYAHFARGWRAYLTGYADSAVASLEQARAAAPAWAEASMALGEVFYHLLPSRQSLDSLAEDAFNTALASDSGFSPPLFHLAELAIRAGRLERAQRIMQRFEQLDPDPRFSRQLQLMFSCVREGADRYDWRESARTTPREVLQASKELAAAGSQLSCAEGGFRRVLASDSADYHWGAFLGLHGILAAQGKTPRVIALADSVVAAGRLPPAMTVYVIDVLAGLPLEAQAASVEQYGKRVWGDGYERLANSQAFDWVLWLFGVWHAHRGELRAVENLQATLQSMATRSPHPSTQLYANALRAHLAVLRADTAEAIRRLGNLQPAAVSDSLAWAFGLPLAAERLQLARLFASRGRHADALRVADTFDHRGPLVYLPFLPASLVLRAHSARARGQEGRAEDYERRLTDLGRADLIEELR